MNITNIYSQFQETFSVKIQQLDRVRRVVQTFIALSVLISELVTCFSLTLFLDRKYKTRHTVPGTTVLCLYTSCLIIMDNGSMRKFSRYTVWILSLVYVLPSSSPSLVTQFLHSDCAGILSLFFWLNILFASLRWTYIAFQAKII